MSTLKIARPAQTGRLWRHWARPSLLSSAWGWWGHVLPKQRQTSPNKVKGQRVSRNTKTGRNGDTISSPVHESEVHVLWQIRSIGLIKISRNIMVRLSAYNHTQWRNSTYTLATFYTWWRTHQSHKLYFAINTLFTQRPKDWKFQSMDFRAVETGRAG